MTPRTKLTKNQRYEKKRKEAGLSKVTVWCPDEFKTELRELMDKINEFYLEKGEYHKKVFPSMYRDVKTGVMGNKSLSEVKKKTSE